MLGLLNLRFLSWRGVCCCQEDLAEAVQLFSQQLQVPLAGVPGQPLEFVSMQLTELQDHHPFHDLHLLLQPLILSKNAASYQETFLAASFLVLQASDLASLNSECAEAEHHLLSGFYPVNLSYVFTCNRWPAFLAFFFKEEVETRRYWEMPSVVSSWKQWAKVFPTGKDEVPAKVMALIGDWGKGQKEQGVGCLIQSC